MKLNKLKQLDKIEYMLRERRINEDFKIDFCLIPMYIFLFISFYSLTCNHLGLQYLVEFSYDLLVTLLILALIGFIIDIIYYFIKIKLLTKLEEEMKYRK